MHDFEKEVLKSFDYLNIKLNARLKIGIAVSGGADSIALLTSMAEICNEKSIPLYVITINHNLRPVDETAGDAEFVESYCHKLRMEEKQIFCTRIEIPRGEIEKLASERKTGIEECARFKRYSHFESFIEINNLDYLCLAHNKNDQLETVLMRFLQGGSVEALAGIQMRRKQFIRPLLNLTRDEIEAYLREKEVSWRTDSTNNETLYLRNRIRHKLLPVLNQNFPDWQNAVIAGAARWKTDADLLQSVADSFHIYEEKGLVSFDIDEFNRQKKAVQLRILLRAVNMAGETNRIPNNFLDDVIASIDAPANKSFVKLYGSVELSKKNHVLFIKKRSKIHTEISFFDIIEEIGNFEFPFGSFTVVSENQKFFVSIGSENVFEIKMPFVVRNVEIDDEIEMTDGTMKRIADIFSDWHIVENEKCMIPVFQELYDKSQRIKCIAGSFLGYKDWIVKR